MKVPKCPEHNKIWECIFADTDKKLISFRCGCVIMRTGERIKQ